MLTEQNENINSSEFNDDDIILTDLGLNFEEQNTPHQYSVDFIHC